MAPAASYTLLLHGVAFTMRRSVNIVCMAAVMMMIVVAYSDLISSCCSVVRQLISLS